MGIEWRGCARYMLGQERINDVGVLISSRKMPWNDIVPREL